MIANLDKLEKLCKKYIIKGHTYSSIAIQILGISERAFRHLRNVKTPNDAKLKLYINTLEKYLD